MAVYIYGLFCPIAETIRYVGKSVNPNDRLLGHLKHARNGNSKHHTGRWLAKLLKQDLVPEVIILHEVQPGEKWQDVERSFIASGASMGWLLTNTTAGGEGVEYISAEEQAEAWAKTGAVVRHKWTLPEYREANKKYWDQPGKRSEYANKTRDRWLDDNQRPALLDSIRKFAAKPEVKAKRNASLKKFYSNPDNVSRMAAFVKAAYAKPGGKDKIRAASSNPAVRLKRSLIGKRNWSKPEFREKMLSALNTPEALAKRCGANSPLKREDVRQKLKATLAKPEVKARYAAATKLRWDDPEYKARVSAKLRIVQADPAYRKKLSDSMNKRVTPEYRAAQSERMLASWAERRAKKSA